MQIIPIRFKNSRKIFELDHCSYREKQFLTNIRNFPFISGTVSQAILVQRLFILLPPTLSSAVMKDIYDKCRNIFTTHKLVVDLFAILFGIGSWIGVNGIFMQLPLMVETHPEGWNLPSYITVITQSGNVGLIIYAVIQKCCTRIKDSWVIHCIQLMSCLCVVLVFFFHKTTTYVNGSEYSIPLFILLFFLAIAGCSSSVVFIPFMNHFKHIYLISYFIGDGLSPLIPSIVALIQGVGGYSSCANNSEVIINNSTNVSQDSEPLFSIEYYFVFIFVMLVLSACAFVLLNNLSYCQSEKVNNDLRKPKQRYGDKSDTLELAETNDGITQINILEQGIYISKSVYIYYLVLFSFVCFLLYGVFPGIMSYSCLPYGNSVYHLALTLSNIANPLSCCIAFVLPFCSVSTISILGVLAAVPASYNIATALLSPMPPLMGEAIGSILVVLSWVAFTGLASFIRVIIASAFHSEDSNALFWYGVTQQIGSAVGSVLSFILVNYTNSFQSYDPCL